VTAALQDPAPREEHGKAAADAKPGNWAAGILALMMFLVPAMGVPNELMLQDTLKSIMVSFATLLAVFVFFWQQRDRAGAMHWHALMWLPLALTVYALGSMAWSHAYLGGVEAVRWFVFGLLLWLGMNTLQRERLPALAWGIHAGAVAASFWAVLQFWVDFRYFSQIAHPASTFVNRNFFAEYLVCTLPFSAWLLARARLSSSIAVLAFSLAFNIVALLMTGTRSAMTATWLLFLVVLPLIFVLYRKQFALASWNAGKLALALGVFTLTLAGLGMIGSNNAAIIATTGKPGVNAFERAFARTASIKIGDESLGERMSMWKVTLRMMGQNPVKGVGAGAWEVQLPLYQPEGFQLETDYYAHNEILQLLAEYGLIGWFFFLSLSAYLITATWKTLRGRTEEAQAQAPIRAIALSSLLMLLVMGSAGFPWHLAGTGALFAVCLAILAASDVRLGMHGRFASSVMAWKPVYSKASVAAVAMLAVLAAYITQQAALSERKIVSALRLALTISRSGAPNDPRWDPVKNQMFAVLREGIAINPHYRKLTPQVADELARWGDWKNAIWVWESVVASRPYVVAILSNIARGYAQIGDTKKALELLAHCKQIQPKAPSVRSLEVILLSRGDKNAEAVQLIKQSLNEGIYDFDLLNAAWSLGIHGGDYELAIRGMELRNKKWRDQRVDGMLRLGLVYAAYLKDEAKALAAYREAMALTPEYARDATRRRIPPAYLARL
jgi:O-antigen ligase